MISSAIYMHNFFRVIWNFLKISIKFELDLKIFLEYQLIKLSDQKIILSAQQSYGTK